VHRYVYDPGTRDIEFEARLDDAYLQRRAGDIDMTSAQAPALRYTRTGPDENRGSGFTLEENHPN